MKRFFLFFVSLILLTGLIPMTVSATRPSSSRQYRGMDVSEWQGTIDFNRVARSGIKVVYIRSSLGNNYVDRQFETNYRKARAAGLSVGFYHYVTARSAKQAAYQADFFVNTIRGKSFDCRLAMDFENLGGLTEGEIRRIGASFLETVEKSSGKGSVLYSDLFNATRTFSGSFTKYPLWIAQYGVARPANTNWEEWVGWQYSDEGRIAGINGYVDLDRFTDGIFLERSGQITTEQREPEAVEETLTYRVRPGDTVWGIASLYHTTVPAIVKANRLSNANRIYVGEQLRIPVEKQDVSPVLHSYPVRKGDYLGKIAAKYGTSVRRLVQLNKIAKPDSIYVGERYWIPVR